MSFIEKTPDSEYYRLDTYMTASTEDTIRAIGSISGINVTDAMNRIIMTTRTYEEQVRSLGALLIADMDDELRVVTKDDEVQIWPIASDPLKAVCVALTEGNRQWLSGRVDPENKTDLVSFWDVSTRFYSDVIDAIMVGKLYRLTPGMRIDQIEMEGSVIVSKDDGERRMPQPRQPWWRRWLGLNGEAS